MSLTVRFSLLFTMIRRPTGTTLFPYTTLFRSVTPDPQAPGQESVWNYPRPAIGEPSRNRRTRIIRSEEHTSELQSLRHLVCRLLLDNKTPSQYAGPEGPCR